jgi:hypothetical protein
MKNVHDGWMMHERLLDESRSHILAPIGCMCVYIYIYIRNVDIEINFYPYLKKMFHTFGCQIHYIYVTTCKSSPIWKF